MATKKAVRKFLEISGLDDAYHHEAQRELFERAEQTATDVDENMLEAIGNEYVDFMVDLYAKSFSRAEIESLISTYETPTFRKLITLTDDFGDPINRFVEKRIVTHLKIKPEVIEPISRTKH